jgi:tetratricopeptide (TPR) repeat protein
VPDSERCENCDAPLSAGVCPRCQTEGESSRLIHRDILLLLAIAIISGAIFLFTRAMAVKERQLNQEVAATWFREGKRQLATGNVRGAADAFRKAASNDYENREYGLALANTLGSAGHTEEARYALLRLRESAPESPEVNLDLARLAAKREDIAEASRYYHNALYGLWTGNQVDREQRQVRTELVRFLLDHQQHSQALSELLILGSDLPDDATVQTDVGQLFLEADDAPHALKHFTHALHLQKDDPAALRGAGEAAFRLGEYAQARRYLEAATAAGDTQLPSQSLALAEMVLSSDPLSPHLPRTERNERLEKALNQSLSRLDGCIARPDINGAVADLTALRSQTTTLDSKLRRGGLSRDPELLDAGMELIDRIAETTKNDCGDPEGLDRALLLIGRKHKGVLQ